MSLRVAANLSLLYPHLAFAERFTAAAADGFTAAELLFPYDVEPDVLAGWLRASALQHVLVNTPPGPTGEPGFAGLPRVGWMVRPGSRPKRGGRTEGGMRPATQDAIEPPCL